MVWNVYVRDVIYINHRAINSKITPECLDGFCSWNKQCKSVLRPWKYTTHWESSLIGRKSFLKQKIGTDERKIQGDEWKSNLRCQKYSTRDFGPPYLQLVSPRISTRPALVILGKLLPEKHIWNKNWRSSEEIKHKYSGVLKMSQLHNWS